MNSLAILYILYLFSERVIQGVDEGRRFIRYVIFFSINIILPLSLFIVRWQLIIFFLLILIRTLLDYFAKKHRLTVSLLAVPFIIITVSFISCKRVPLNYYSLYFWHWLAENSYIFGFISSHANAALNVILGTLIVGFESNNLVIFILKKLNFIHDKSVEPNTGSLNDSEIRRGHVIGILERLLIFFLIFIGQPSAITLVVAVKGIYRYKTLDDRNFTEYVLIGSLLSLLIAFAMSYIVVNINLNSG